MRGARRSRAHAPAPPRRPRRAAGECLSGRRGAAQRRRSPARVARRASVPGLAGERRAVLEGVVLGETQNLSPRCSSASARAACTTCLRSAAATCSSSRAAPSSSCSHSGSRGSSAESRRCSRSAATSSPSARSRRCCAPASPARSARSRGSPDASATAGMRSCSVRRRCSPESVDAARSGLPVVVRRGRRDLPRAPRLRRVLDGYPLPRGSREPIALSAVCGAATAPISWFHFHQIPLLTIPANVAAAPVVAPMLALALLAAFLPPLGPLLAHVNGCSPRTSRAVRASSAGCPVPRSSASGPPRSARARSW